MKPCFENLVALSRTDCECYDLEEIVQKTNFGLFLDEHEGIDLQLIQNALKCGEDLQKNYNRIYENALNFLESDLQVEISNQYKQRYSTYVGRIGERKYSRTVPASTLAGIKLDTTNAEGASIVLKAIHFYFANTGELTLSVYKNGEKLEDDYTVTIDTSAVLFELPSPLILPITENGIRNEYHLFYETNGLQPMDNKTTCNCSGIENARKKYLTPKGVSGETFETLKDNSTYAYGMSLEVTISCSIDNLVCGFMLDSTFERRFAIAQWYKMAVLTIEALFASREINFDTFSDRDYLYGRNNKFAKEYSGIVTWLSENTNIHESNCFICNSNKVMSMGKNLI